MVPAQCYVIFCLQMNNFSLSFNANHYILYAFKEVKKFLQLLLMYIHQICKGEDYDMGFIIAREA